MDRNIAVVGLGYVGLPVAVTLENMKSLVLILMRTELKN